MLRIVKVGSIGIAGGALVGLSVVAWLYLHQSAVPVLSKGGSIAMSTADTPPERHTSDLRVASPASVAASGGLPDTVLGAQTTSGGNSNSGLSNTSSADAPDPAEFAQYEKYRDDKAALYGDLIAGKGAEVAAGSTLLVHYKGWLTSGKLFDETHPDGDPFTFKEGDHRVILGWEEGLLGMKVGGKRRLIVPPSVGYGATGHDPIPPNAVLIFDVELVAVQ